jgi:hypothetical protein
MVQNALEKALVGDGDSVSEVVIDYSNVDGVAGDGPIWSASPAYRRKLGVCFVASAGPTFEWLSQLLDVTNMDRLIRLEKCAGESGSAQ